MSTTISNPLRVSSQALPLNGETAYADTAAAYDALGADEQRRLDDVMIRRRRREHDDGFLMPLVYVNPRNGKKSLHSPVWASRGKPQMLA